MRYILYIITILFSLDSYGQGTWNRQAVNNKINRSQSDSVAIMPRDTAATNEVINPATGQPVGDSGRIAYMFGKFWGHNATGWNELGAGAAGSVPSSRLINTTLPLLGGGDLSADRTLSIQDAVADGTTKGAASFTAADFNSLAGNISLDTVSWPAYTKTQSDGRYIWNSPVQKVGEFNITGAGVSATGFNVNKNMDGVSGAMISMQNTHLLGGGITFGNATSLGGFLPIISTTTKYDTTDPVEYRSSFLQSKYNSVDTSGKSAGDMVDIMTSGGIYVNPNNLNNTYATTALYDNVFGIITPHKNNEADSTISPIRNNILLRVGGDATLQTRGTIAVGYPFTEELGEKELLGMFKKVPVGNAAIFNGRVSGNDAVNDSDYVTYRQYGYADVKAYGATGDGTTDDAAAFTAAIATGKPVFIPKGTFLLNSTITLPVTCVIVGTGTNSIIKTTSNSVIFNCPNGYVTIKDVRFLGSGRGTVTPYETTNPNQHAISFSGTSAKNVVINVLFQQMGGAAIYTINNVGIGSNYEGNQIVANRMEECWAGFYADFHGEYNVLSANTIYRCEYGFYSEAGNNSITGGNITACRTGIYIGSDADNDGHCGSSNVKINHSLEYSLRAENVLYGYFFDGCLFTLGDIYINNSNAIKFKDCEIVADTIFAKTATRAEFTGNRFRSTTPVLWLSYNGTDNTGSASDVTFFNNAWEPGLPSTITPNSLVGTLAVSGHVFPLTMSRASFGNFSYVLTSDPMGLGASLANNSITLRNNTVTGDIAFASNSAAQPNMILKQNGNLLLNTTTDNGAKLVVNGNVSTAITTVTGNTTLNATHSTVLVNNSGSVTITLPAASGKTGWIYTIKKVSAASNDVLIDPNGSELLDGSSTSKTLTLQWSSVTIQSNGTSWFLLSSHAAATTL